MNISSRHDIIARYGLIGSIAWLLVAMTVLVVTIISHQPANISKPLVYNMTNSDTTTGKIRYYNGNTFVTYDTQRHKVLPLTNFRRLTNLLDVFWLKDGAIITASYINPGSDLSQKYNSLVSHYATIPGAELTDPTQVYWYVSFKTNEVSVLKVGRVNTTLFGTQTEDGGYIYADTDDYSYISSDGKVTRHVLSTTSPDNTRIVWCDNSQIIYLTPSEKSGVTVHVYDRKKQSEVSTIDKLDSTGELTIYNSFVATSPSMIYYTDSSNLSYVNPQKKQTATIERNVNGQLSKMDGEIYGFNVGTTNLSLVKVVDAHLVSRLEMDAPFSRPSFVFKLEDTVFGYADLNGHLVGVSKEKRYLEAFKPGYSEPLEKKIPALQRNIMSDYDNNYTYSIVSGSISEGYDTIWKQIEKEGLNPYEFTLEVIGGNSATE